ncbi:hypothetical protein ABGV17_02775 [Guyparkeria sp. GHLCS8-2]
MVNAQRAQQVGVRTQKQAMKRQEQAMAPLIGSIGQGGAQITTCA